MWGSVWAWGGSAWGWELSPGLGGWFRDGGAQPGHGGLSSGMGELSPGLGRLSLEVGAQFRDGGSQFRDGRSQFRYEVLSPGMGAQPRDGVSAQPGGPGGSAHPISRTRCLVAGELLGAGAQGVDGRGGECPFPCLLRRVAACSGARAARPRGEGAPACLPPHRQGSPPGPGVRKGSRSRGRP